MLHIKDYLPREGEADVASLAAGQGCMDYTGLLAFARSRDLPMTLEDTGMLTALRHDPGITLLDRAQAKTPEETKKIYHDALSSDFYFMSTNAITKDGELVNIDGTGNRVAALIYGPEHVIVMAGMNKVAANVDEALSRVHGTATPMNCKRLGKNTPCSATGVCSDCLSPDCICNQVVITRRSGIEGRIKVILIGEELGY